VSPPERHTYGEHPSQYAELWRPAAGTPATAAVLVHGGGWRAGRGAELNHALAADLAARGWLAWNIEYRRLGDGGGWPQTFDDVRAAIAALPREGVRRVVAIGHSAGGHLALWAAPHVDAVVAQAPVTDLVEASRLGISDGAVDELLGGSPDDVPHRYTAVSPPRPLPVPGLIIHGDRDPEVPVAMSQAYADAAGCRLAVLPDTGHQEHLDPASRAWATAVGWLSS
jgi:acetyl esterase/lipase